MRLLQVRPTLSGGWQCATRSRPGPSWSHHRSAVHKRRLMSFYHALARDACIAAARPCRAGRSKFPFLLSTTTNQHVPGHAVFVLRMSSERWNREREFHAVKVAPGDECVQSAPYTCLEGNLMAKLKKDRNYALRNNVSRVAARAQGGTWTVCSFTARLCHQPEPFQRQATPAKSPSTSFAT